MLSDIFKNRLFIGALVFFILCVIGGTLYIGYVEQQGAKELAEAEERIKQLTEKQNEQPTAKVPVGDTSQGGHWHGDEWHAEPHEPVEQPAKEPYEPIVEINHEWASLTDEERLQWNKERNQEMIAEYANDPRYAEIHKLMSENEYPYSPQVQAKIDAAYKRFYLKRSAHYKAVAEIEAKMDDPNISPRELMRLTRERLELRERYKGGQ